MKAKILALLLCLVIAIFAVVSCQIGGTGGGNGEGEGTGGGEGAGEGEGTGGGDGTNEYPEGTEGLIYNKNSEIRILVGEGIDQDKAMDIYNVLARLVMDPEKIKLSTSSDPEAEHEIVLGNSSREITQKAYKKLERVRDSMNDESGYVIYSDGSSLAVVWDESDHDDVRNIALNALINKALTTNFLICPAGTLDAQKVDTFEYWKEKDEEYVEKQWAAVSEALGEDGAKIVSELKTLQSMVIGKGDIVSWFANLVDTDICACQYLHPDEYAAAGNTCLKTKYCGGAGYYYSNSARNTNGYLPDLESTSQALGFWESSGMTYYIDQINSGKPKEEQVSAIPEWLLKKMGDFAYSLQDEDGYFYHPQWDRDFIITNNKSSRRSRDLGHGESILARAGMTPKYTTPSDMGSEAEPTSKSMTSPLVNGGKFAAAAKVLAVADSVNLDDRLKDKESFEAYLDTLDIRNRSYHVGNTLTALTSEILARDKKLAEEGANYKLIDIAVEWLSKNQNPESGDWNWPNSQYYDDAYYGVNGILKIVGVYDAGQTPFPNAEAACRTIMKAITAEQQIGAGVDVYNTWYALRNVLDTLEEYGTSADQEMIEDVYAEIRRLAPAGIKASREKITALQLDDGSFAYGLTAEGKPVSATTSQGCPAAVPNSSEGDVNGTVIAANGVRNHIFRCLKMSSLKPILLGEADRQRYIFLIENLNSIKKDDEFVDIVYASFDSEAVGQPATEVDLSKLSTGGSAKVVKDPRGDGNVLEFKTQNGFGDYIYVNDPSFAPSLKTICFEGEFCATSVGSYDYVLQFFIGDAAMMTFNFSDPKPLVNEEGEYIDKEGNVLPDGATPVNQFSKVHIWNRSASSDAKSQDIELDVDIAVGQWFSLKVEYFYGDHDTVRLKIYVDEDLEDKTENMKLVAVTDNYYDYYGNKLNGRGTPSDSFTQTRIYAMMSAEATILMDNLASYRTKKAYEAESDPANQPSYNIDPPDREELIYDFEADDDITSGGAYTVKNNAPVSVQNGALNINYTSGEAPELDIPVVVRTKGTDCTTIEMDIKWDGATSGKEVLNITATDRFAMDRRVIAYTLAVEGNNLILKEVASNGSKSKFEGITIPKSGEGGKATKLCIDFYTSKNLSLFYVDGVFAGASDQALGSSGAKCEIFDLSLALVKNNKINLTLDNIRFEKNTKSFDTAVAPKVDSVTETFDKLDANLYGGGAIIGIGDSGKMINLKQNGSWLKLPINQRSNLTNVYSVALDMIMKKGNGPAVDLHITNEDGKIVWALEMVVNGKNVQLYEKGEGGVVADAPLVTYPLEKLFKLSLELYPEEKKLLVFNEGNCVAISSAYYNAVNLASKSKITSLEIYNISANADAVIDNAVTESLYKYYVKPSISPVANPEHSLYKFTFDHSSTGNISNNIKYNLASYAADIRIEQLLNTVTKRYSNVLALETSAGNNDKVEFKTAIAKDAKGVAFEADMRLDKNATTQVFLDGASRAYMFTLQVSGGSISITDTSYNGSGAGKAHGETLYTGLSTGAWFNLRVEYYYGTKGTVRIVFLINDKAVAISDNYYGVGSNITDAAPVKNVSGITFYTMNASEGVIYFDNVSYGDITNTYKEKEDEYLKTATTFIDKQDWKKSELKVRVVNPDNEPMEGIEIEFFADGEPIGTATTESHEAGNASSIYASYRTFLSSKTKYSAQVRGADYTLKVFDEGNEIVIVYS